MSNERVNSASRLAKQFLITQKESLERVLSYFYLLDSFDAYDQVSARPDMKKLTSEQFREAAELERAKGPGREEKFKQLLECIEKIRDKQICDRNWMRQGLALIGEYIVKANTKTVEIPNKIRELEVEIEKRGTGTTQSEKSRLFQLSENLPMEQDKVTVFLNLQKELIGFMRTVGIATRSAEGGADFGLVV